MTGATVRVDVAPGLPVRWVCWSTGGVVGVLVRPDVPMSERLAVAAGWARDTGRVAA